MEKCWIAAIIIVIAIILIALYATRESYTLSRYVNVKRIYSPRWSSRSQTAYVPRTYSAKQRYVRQLTRPTRSVSTGRWQAPQIRQTPGNPGLPLGHAYGQPGTGIVPGSSIAGLQQTYRNIYTPYTPQAASGQLARQQHLYGQALGTPLTNPNYPTNLSSAMQSGQISPGLGLTGWQSQGSGIPGRP